LRYTPEGTDIEIAVGTDNSQPDQTDHTGETFMSSVIKIRDHGPGISAEDAEKIFQRFYRADTSRHRNTGGGGLGLAIVGGIRRQSQGTVCHEGTPGGGAAMVFQLAYHPLDDDDGASPEGFDDG